MYDISVGDRFYANTHTVKKGLSLPDYLRVTGLISLGDHMELDYIEARYENHYVGSRERLFSSVILDHSNLNPKCKKPTWIFVKGES